MACGQGRTGKKVVGLDVACDRYGGGEWKRSQGDGKSGPGEQLHDECMWRWASGYDKCP